MGTLKIPDAGDIVAPGYRSLKHLVGHWETGLDGPDPVEALLSIFLCPERGAAHCCESKRISGSPPCFSIHKESFWKCCTCRLTELCWTGCARLACIVPVGEARWIRNLTWEKVSCVHSGRAQSRVILAASPGRAMQDPSPPENLIPKISAHPRAGQPLPSRADGG